jgi:hypothetical protein
MESFHILSITGIAAEGRFPSEGRECVSHKNQSRPPVALDQRIGGPVFRIESAAAKLKRSLQLC